MSTTVKYSDGVPSLLTLGQERSPWRRVYLRGLWSQNQSIDVIVEPLTRTTQQAISPVGGLLLALHFNQQSKVI